MNVVHACGIPRSGSTLVHQILRSVLDGWDIRHSHPAALIGRRDEPLLATYRDPYDVAASRYRVRISRGGESDGGAVGLMAEIDEMHRHFSAFIALDRCNMVSLRYESYWNNHAPIYNAIEEVCGVRVDEDRRLEISERFSVKANRERAGKLADFNQVDDTGIHGAHVATPEPGGWRMMPEWSRTIIVQRASQYRETLGYA